MKIIYSVVTSDVPEVMLTSFTDSTFVEAPVPLKEIRQFSAFELSVPKK
jgi:hypothetical protein